tara:strand:- start:14219 stop:14413 length:195 start_codon:yes stop_codon:yes gene_type:complete
MIKKGNKVSLFNDIGKVGEVIGHIAIKSKNYHTGGSASHSWRILIQWNDGTRSEEAIGDVMRLD